MAIIGFSRSAKMGVSAIVGLGNKADLDEDDLLTFFEQDDETQIIAMHCEDLKDGRSFAEVASRVVEEKAGDRAEGRPHRAWARAPPARIPARSPATTRSMTTSCASAGVIRAPGLRDMLDYARGLQKLPTPKGENVVIITGAGGSGVLLSDACVDNGLNLMRMPPDLDQAFRKFIPPFGAAGNPVDITGGEPPTTYQNTIRLGLEDKRIHALILGYWHTIITPPMVFAQARDRGRRRDEGEGDREADRRLARRRCSRSRRRRSSLRPRHSGLCLLDRNPGRGARREISLGARRGTDQVTAEGEAVP